MEIWGGIECTVNRVEDVWFDQIIKTGHEARSEDLDLLAELGIKKIRYPVLWERIAPNGLEHADWSWTDERLHKLKELGIVPIVGLLHHGSGPANTNLLDPDFPQKLVAFAQAVAERYPWIEYYTPINEPLTTARFSGLYGIWYPHLKNDTSFAMAFLNQCKATIEVMKAIKALNPLAKLVQTEDLGKTFSTPELAYQAKFENERRWLTFDFLLGKFNPTHKLWKYFIWAGIKETELNFFTLNHCMPDIIGINYYITSERFIDSSLDKYPQHLHGGNGENKYVDVEAVRVRRKGIYGLENLLKEVAKRYKAIPIAVTEVHIGCTRDEQLRWLNEVYESTKKLNAKGLPIVAITSWALFGAYNWNVLLTHDNNYYEPGAFDVRSKIPRITAVGQLIKKLCKEQIFDHEVLKTAGWWNRDERLLFQSKPQTIKITTSNLSIRPLAITGATGTLGKAFARICEIRNIPYRLLSRNEMDIANFEEVNNVVNDIDPWAIVNAAGYVKVDNAENDKERCMRENAFGPVNLATICRNREIGLINFSSDLVFDGESNKPYLESSATKPLSVYGLSKKQAEERILKLYPQALIIRTSAFFSPWDEYNFVTQALKHIHKGQVFMASSENVVSPTYVPDLVNASLDLLIDGESGIWHLTNPSEITWSDFAIATAKMAGFDHSLVKPFTPNKRSYLAGRPIYSALGSERGLLLPPLHHAIKRYVNECDLIEYSR